MSLERDIREAIRAIAKQSSVLLVNAKVLTVDGDTCTVDINGLEVSGVRLTSGVTSSETKLIVEPAANSIVTLISTTEDLRDMQILKYSETGNIVIDGGENGGLCITPELVDNLDKTNDVLQSIMTVVNGAPIPEPGNGAPSALQASLALAISNKVLGDFSSIENDKIKH